MSTMVKEIYKALKSAGADEELAVAAAEAVPSTEDLATKADIAATKADIAATKADIADLKVAIAALRADIYRQLWMMGVSLMAAMVALKLFA